MRKQLLVVGAIIAMAFAESSKAAVPWVPAAGNTGTFAYTNGENAVGKFGTPTSNITGFIFSPTQFVASATGTSTPVSTTDTASVIIHSDPLIMRSITAQFLGDYTILGTGSVNATGLLKATNLDTLAVVTQAATVSGVPVSTNSSGDGGFYGSSTVTFPEGWQNFKIELTTTVNATAGSNGVALIQAKSADIVIRAKLLPEPASLMALGMLGLVGRRSRR